MAMIEAEFWLTLFEDDEPAPILEITPAGIKPTIRWVKIMQTLGLISITLALWAVV